jgi:hypothetical protein
VEREHRPTARDVAAVRPDVEAKRERTEVAPGLDRYMRSRPFIALVGERLLRRIFVLAAAVHVVGRHGRVVVARHARDAVLTYHGGDLVRPRRVAHQIAKMIRRAGGGIPLDIGEHGLERREVGVNIGDQGVAHGRPSPQGSCAISGAWLGPSAAAGVKPK